jgi:hypothetical protein
MATTDAAVAAHALILPYLFENVYGPGSFTAVVGRLAADGVLQVDRLYEMFEAKQWGTTIDSADGHDLANGMECKLRSTFLTEGSHATFLDRAATANKTGDVILGVVNRERGTFDRFLLPRGEGYTPGKTKRLTWSRRDGGWGINQKWLIDSTKF